MVQALLDGSKTQTRRTMRKQFPADASMAEIPATSRAGWVVAGHSGLWWDDAASCIDDAVRCPYGIPGDQLWVRETFQAWPDGYAYRADYRDKELGDAVHAPWKPSIFMPRAASRITLEIVSVRVERLNDISRGDAMAEGCPFPNMAKVGDPRKWYAGLWEQINGADSWGANPWVWCVSFKVVKP
jgi:hypothetical protein